MIYPSPCYNVPIEIMLALDNTIRHTVADVKKNGVKRMRTATVDKLTISVDEMSARLGISRNSAYELTRVEGFPMLRIGARKLINVKALQEWLDQQMDKGTEN